MKFKTLFLCFFSLLIMTQCEAQKRSNKTKKTKTQTVTNTTQGAAKEAGEDQNLITLREGENLFLEQYKMNVTFSGVTEDSRCPTGTNCVWQGVGVVQINVMGIYTRPANLTLATIDLANKGYQNSAVFNGYKITLRDLSPYPTMDKQADKLAGSYKVTLQFTKDIVESPQNTPEKQNPSPTTR